MQRLTSNHVAPCLQAKMVSILFSRRATALITAFSLATVVTNSMAQVTPSLIGAWSTSMPGQGGTAHATESFSGDGTYLAVRQEPNGTVLRMWGRFRVVTVSPTQMRLEHEMQGWLPRRICAQSPGFPIHCGAFTPPAAPPVTLTFLSPSTFTVNGLTVVRDASPRLLNIPVAEQLVFAAPAPVSPRMAQPVMPTLHPYVTPHDPPPVPLATTSSNRGFAQSTMVR